MNIKKNHGIRAFITPLFGLLTVLAIAIGSELSTIFQEISEATAVNNLIQIYGATSDMWNYINLVSHAVDSAIIWGKDRIIMGAPAHKTAALNLKYIQEELIPGYKRMTNQNLGNFSTYYNRIMIGDLNFCDNMMKSYEGQYEGCGEGASAMWKGNLYNIMIKSTSVVKSILDDYERVMDSYTDRIDLLNQSAFKTYRSYTVRANQSWFEHYYTITIPLSKTIEIMVNKDGQLDANSNIDAIFFAKLHGAINFLVGIVIFFVFVKPMRQRFRYLGNMIQLLPFNLLSSNSIFGKAILDWNKWNS